MTIVDQIPWKIKVTYNQDLSSDQRFVWDVIIQNLDKELKQYLQEKVDVYFIATFKQSWISRKIKSVRVSKTNRPLEGAVPFNTSMRFAFDNESKGILFSQAIEISIEKYIVAQSVERHTLLKQ